MSENHFFRGKDGSLAPMALADVAAYLSDLSARIYELECSASAAVLDKETTAVCLAGPYTGDNAADPVRAVAATIWGEARGESPEGMLAVACVIRNRVQDPCWWGNDWSGVCTAPKQFSCWWDRQGIRVRTVYENDPKFAKCLEIAEAVISGRAEDITGGADHYHTGAVSPSWSKGVTPVKVIGAHRFFKLGKGAGSYRA